MLTDFTIRGAEAHGAYLNQQLIRNVHFHDNRGNDGAALDANWNTRVESCRFTGNHATVGGAIVTHASSVLVTGCYFEGNTATVRGGALYVGSSSFSPGPDATLIVDCTFVGNDAPLGSAVYLRYVNVANCTFDGNTGSATIAVADIDPDWDYRVVNSIILSGAWPPFEIVDPGAGVISHCLLSEAWPGEAMIVGDPMFVDAANGDYRLQPGSPAIDAGHSARRGAARWVDADGAPRMADDPAVKDTGEALGALPVVDLGAYERQ